MSGSKCFIDTNVWLYAFIRSDDTGKHDTAKGLIETAKIVTSFQVINELCVNLLKKTTLKEPDISGIISSFYNRYEVIESGQILLQRATDLRSNFNFSYWDSLIVAAALMSEAKTLYTEDMHNGLVIDKTLTIVNPFKG
jgi:predicted nucleic acid-binding protein